MTHTRRSEKVFIMKRLLLILILTFSFQTVAEADDITDFEIEGMSIGDSLLDYFNEEVIINKRKTHYKEKFVAILIRKNNLKNYEYLQFVFKPNDQNYIIHSVEGHIDYPDNFQDCLKQRKIIDNELAESILDIIKIIKEENESVNYDKSGNTKSYTSEYYLKEGHIRVSCTNYSEELTKKNGWVDDLKVVVNSSEFTQFLINDW